MRVLFSTVGLAGHFFPLVSLAWAFRARGHEVLVACSEGFAQTALRSGLPVASSGRSPHFADLVAELLTSPVDEPGDRAHLHGRAFGRIAAASLSGTDALVRSWKPTLIISERAEFAGRVVAGDHGVPWVEYRWGAAELAGYRLGARAELPGSATEGWPEPAQVLNPWPPSLRLRPAAGHRSLRFVPYNGDAHLPAWAFEDSGKPRICLTVGTLLPQLGANAVQATLLPTLAALGRLDVELLVAVADEVAATWPPLPVAVRAAGRLPLDQTLRTCDLAVTHGGQGTALTALGAGCPQVVLPQVDDQFDNADAVVKAGAGVRLLPTEVSPDAVVRCCREVLGSPSFRRAALAVAGEIADLPSPAEIATSLEMTERA
ncbi:DUF1205 domain-containing protein [Amycolatopsis rhizosphaerae]|uniref:DUF1205 domain-containing protein n=1 Tax=Amycolatopsis rhizosphaerae TaxID=2053003 RepID=A0A558DHK6_9PSEU|nr:nucleotide disphospho-sugar-binding domain-containing protein [Amycolatopsis rhizosphaerae]TVT60498.1 DUF1205 domain-containing protein [Amycolatopsis rhizosphaerae]